MADPRILVIGAGEADYDGANIVYTDVAFGRTVAASAMSTICRFPTRTSTWPSSFPCGNMLLTLFRGG